MIIEGNIFYCQGLSVTDRQIHDCSWDEYLQLPGISHSGLKEKQEWSDNVIAGMRIGTLVHTYILKPSEYKYEEPEIVRPIAGALIRFVGHALLQSMTCEKGVTAKFTVEGVTLLYKGMPDMFVVDNMVIDFKIIKSGTIESYVERLGYKNQLRGYMLALRCRYGQIIAYNRAKKRIELFTVTLDDIDFWKNVTISRGTVFNASH